MKLSNFKTVALTLLASAMFVLSGCGSEGTPSDHDLVGDPQQAPYEITAYQGSTAVLHSHVATPNGTHQWTQVSGPTVTIANPTSPTATVVVPTSATAPIVIHHSNTVNGQTVTTAHTIAPVVATIPLSVIVSKPETVLEGFIASLHASVSGGTAPYTYVWTQTQGITVTLDETHPSAPTFTIPRNPTHQNETFTFQVRVLDSAGAEITSKEETINAVSAFLLIDAPASLPDVHLKEPYNPNAPHEVGSGRIFITNTLPGETYTWAIKETTGATPPLVNLRVTNTQFLNGKFGIIEFSIGDVKTKTTYNLEIVVTSDTGRAGFSNTTVEIIPK